MEGGNKNIYISYTHDIPDENAMNIRNPVNDGVVNSDTCNTEIKSCR